MGIRRILVGEKQEESGGCGQDLPVGEWGWGSIDSGTVMSNPALKGEIQCPAGIPKETILTILSTSYMCEYFTGFTQTAVRTE